VLLELGLGQEISAEMHGKAKKSVLTLLTTDCEIAISRNVSILF
jgi:hypothetical protein